MADERRTGIGEGIRNGIGILAALKDALEQTLAEATEKGDLTPDRATQAMKDVVRKVQDSVEEARTRLDFISSQEFEALQAEVREISRRVGVLEARGAAPREPGVVERIPLD